MMPGVGFEEMILLVLVAIVVIGPKDLPLMMRKFGRFTGKMRAMAFEFKQGFDELGRQAELEELRKEVASLKQATGLEDLRKDFEADKINLESDVRSALADSSPPTPTPSPGQAAPGAEPPPAPASSETPSSAPPVATAAIAAAPIAAETANALPPVRSADKWPKPIKRTPTHPAAASAVNAARPDPIPPAPYAGLSADHPGYDTGEDFRLEGHPPETMAPAQANGDVDPTDEANVHIIPDDEVRLPPVKQDTPA